MLKLKRVLPLLVFLGLGVFLWRGLSHDPHNVPSPLINQVAPAFSAYDLVYPNRWFNQEVFKGKVTLLSVFASWCGYCVNDHAVLMKFARKAPVLLIGLNYKDTRIKALDWLQAHGNPFRAIINDASGKIAIDFGVYGTPETFVIDEYGVIRYKVSGPLTSQVWQQKIAPLIEQLRKRMRSDA